MIVPTDECVELVGWYYCTCGGFRCQLRPSGRVMCLTCGEPDHRNEEDEPSQEDTALAAALLRAAGYTGVICITDQELEDYYQQKEQV